jgi:hypothetical protein
MFEVLFAQSAKTDLLEICLLKLQIFAVSLFFLHLDLNCLNSPFLKTGVA